MSKDLIAKIDAVYAGQSTDGLEWALEEETKVDTRSWRFRLGRETIRLNLIEFRILEVLASRPYHAFPRRRIIEAVSSELYPVTDETLDQHIASLRDRLGFFRDYIQTVPYIGYRFKA